jgi:hypothetical protein
MSRELILVPKLRYEELVKQEVNNENEKTTTFKKDDTIPVTNTDKGDEYVKNPDGEQSNMEGGGRSYISLSPEEFSEHKSNKEKVLKHETKTNTRKMLKKQEEIKRETQVVVFHYLIS